MGLIGQMTRYELGKSYPLEFNWDLQFGVLESPVWFALVSKPQRERNAKAWLERRGLEVWYPTEMVWRNAPRGKRKKVQYERLVVPRYLFVRFTGHPRWNLLFEETPGNLHLSGVVGHAGQPMRITKDDWAKMKLLPDRMREKREEEEEQRRIHVGDQVEVIEGPFSEYVVEVINLKGTIATILLPLLGGGEVKINLQNLRKA